MNVKTPKEEIDQSWKSEKIFWRRTQAVAISNQTLSQTSAIPKTIKLKTDYSQQKILQETFNGSHQFGEVKTFSSQNRRKGS